VNLSCLMLLNLKRRKKKDLENAKDRKKAEELKKAEKDLEKAEKDLEKAEKDLENAKDEKKPEEEVTKAKVEVTKAKVEVTKAEKEVKTAKVELKTAEVSQNGKLRGFFDKNAVTDHVTDEIWTVEELEKENYARLSYQDKISEARTKMEQVKPESKLGEIDVLGLVFVKEDVEAAINYKTLLRYF